MFYLMPVAGVKISVRLAAGFLFLKFARCIRPTKTEYNGTFFSFVLNENFT